MNSAVDILDHSEDGQGREGGDSLGLPLSEL